MVGRLFGMSTTASGRGTGPLSGIAALALATLTAFDASAFARASTAFALAVAAAAVLAAVWLLELVEFLLQHPQLLFQQGDFVVALWRIGRWACEATKTPVSPIAAAVSFALRHESSIV